MESILLIGVTGPLGLGRFIVDNMTSQLHYFKRVAIFHDISRPTNEHKNEQLTRWKQVGIEVVAAHGYETSEPFSGFDCVVSLLGNHALHLQPKIIDLAIAAGVRHFYPSEYGADLTVGQNWHQRYYKYKVATRDHLERRAQDVFDLGWTLFLLGRLTEWSVLPLFSIANADCTAKIYGTTAGRQSLLAVRDAAAYIVATLKAPLDRTVVSSYRRTFRISGSSPTYSELFNALQAVRGQEYQVAYHPTEEAVVEEREAKMRGDVVAELEANHKLIQGRQGTLLPAPWDNDKFPNIEEPISVRQALEEAFQSAMFRKAYGLSP